MDTKMFCFQCEQTAGCHACTGNAGVCGKKSDTAALQDQLTAALIDLARAVEGNEHLLTSAVDRLVIRALFSTLTNVNFNNDSLSTMIREVTEAREPLTPDCILCAEPC